jgi:hypothetical protein
VTVRQFSQPQLRSRDVGYDRHVPALPTHLGVDPLQVGPVIGGCTVGKVQPECIYAGVEEGGQLAGRSTGGAYRGQDLRTPHG